ncbi:MAG: hypothetical protein KF749_06360 [Bacteroidetes bacterium]|nr:hypothetical protein [Bacteroidota bacterium]MCW5894590.1 hypothetical protein [Bacteroidota bacterium]
MDIESILRSLNAHKVQYVIIGAAAFPAHGYSRPTGDIDIFVRATPKNAQRTLEALTAVGYDVADTSVEELLEKKLLFRQYAEALDIHPHVKGAEFKNVWLRKVTDKVGQTKTYFSSLNDLIRMKEAAGRPKDLLDLEVLRKLKERKKRKRFR